MPLRLPPLVEQPTRLLLEGLIDYAGLFPPASLDMQSAVRNFAHYRARGDGWMLGRFVCSAARLVEFSEVADPLLPRDPGAIPWRISVTGTGDPVADMEAIVEFNKRHRVCFDECSATVDCYEARASSLDEIARINAAVPTDLLTYVEVPLDDTLDTFIAVIASSGRRAKMRTGGVVVEAFPSPSQVIAFIRACLDHNVTAKATAGLHHPVCGTYRLTYQPGAPTGLMFGFFNVLLAAAALADNLPDVMALRLLAEKDPQRMVPDDTGITWHDGEQLVRIERHAIKRVRDQLIVSIGSCSFTEPVDESRALGWI